MLIVISETHFEIAEYQYDGKYKTEHGKEHHGIGKGIETCLAGNEQELQPPEDGGRHGDEAQYQIGYSVLVVCLYTEDAEQQQRDIIYVTANYVTGNEPR